MRDAIRIGEFSALGRVSGRMLRRYEKLGLLAPAATDAFARYRSYTLDQLPRLNRIIALKELGFSLEQVGGVTEKSPTAEEMKDMLDARRPHRGACAARRARRSRPARHGSGSIGQHGQRGSLGPGLTDVKNPDHGSRVS